MSDRITIVRIQIEESQSGLLFATSEDLPGLVIAHRELQKIIEDLPAVIKLMFKRRYDMDVEVREARIGTEQEQTGLVPAWAAIPAHIAAAGCAPNG